MMMIPLAIDFKWTAVPRVAHLFRLKIWLSHCKQGLTRLVTRDKDTAKKLDLKTKI